MLASVTVSDKPAQLCAVILCLVHLVYGDNKHEAGTSEDLFAYVTLTT